MARNNGTDGHDRAQNEVEGGGGTTFSTNRQSYGEQCVQAHGNEKGLIGGGQLEYPTHGPMQTHKTTNAGGTGPTKGANHKGQP